MLLAHMTSFELPTLVAAAGVGFVSGVAVCFMVMRHLYATSTQTGTQVARSVESDR